MRGFHREKRWAGEWEVWYLTMKNVLHVSTRLIHTVPHYNCKKKEKGPKKRRNVVFFDGRTD